MTDRLPDFIHLGPGRTGTTLLYGALREHPDVFLPEIKEILYFTREYDRTEEWYRNFFVKADHSQVVGEFSNNYFFNELVPQRIADTIPNVKLIVTLRNPYERFVSIFIYLKYRLKWIDADKSLEQAVTQDSSLIDGYLRDGDSLERYLNLMARDNLYIGLYDELYSNTPEYIQSLYRFIDVDDSYLPANSQAVVNQSAQVKSQLISRMAYPIANTLRQYQLHSLLGNVKNSQILRRMFFQPLDISTVEKRTLIESARKVLAEYVEPQISLLESLTQRDLSEWRAF